MRQKLALRPAHSRGHQFVTHYPKASDISSPPCLLRVLPAGAVAGWALHPLEKRRLVTAHVACGHSQGISVPRFCGLQDFAFKVWWKSRRCGMIGARYSLERR